MSRIDRYLIELRRETQQLPLLCFNQYPFPIQETDNALVTPLGLRVLIRNDDLLIIGALVSVPYNERRPTCQSKKAVAVFFDVVKAFDRSRSSSRLLPPPPLLYSMYTNDIPRQSSSVQLALFADDTALYVRARLKKSTFFRLQRAIDELSRWFCTWRIKGMSSPVDTPAYRPATFGEAIIEVQLHSVADQIIPTSGYALLRRNGVPTVLEYLTRGCCDSTRRAVGQPIVSVLAVWPSIY
ncbi:hypothetical protein EVAR_36811_1 [Eumeta japonica]|uniref:Reverse transcriptase domain-containing protein n=1 Tax=Eumeta variegata TaxID=151549 RepID=A0A4C1WUX0_EUMVA|nr:hypothetical protein EVAR_36811_1 [Eumeta japonica]